MIEIVGQFNTAKCFTSQLEDMAAEQIKAVCDTAGICSAGSMREMNWLKETTMLIISFTRCWMSQSLQI